MPTQPNIALGINAPQPIDPLSRATQVLQLKDLMQQQSLRAAQTSQYAAETEQKQRDLQDNTLVQNSQPDPDFHAAYAKAGATGDISPITDYFTKKGGIQEKTAAGLATNAQNIYKNAQLISEKDRTESDTDAGKIPSIVAGLDQKDDDIAAQQAKAALQRLSSTAASAKTAPLLQQVIPNINASNVRKVMSSLLDTVNQREAFNSQVTARQKAVAEAEEAASKAKSATLAAQTGEQGQAATFLGSLDPNDDQVQAKLDAFKAGVSPATQALLPATADADSIKNAITKLNPKYAGELAQAPVVQAIADATKNDKGLLTPEQRQQATNQEAQLANEKARTELEKKRYGLEAQKFAMQFGGDAIKGWTEVIKDNPDAVSEIPADLKTKVMETFRSETGLPLPKPLTGSALDQERAARNTLQRLPRIEQLMNDPELQDSLGPVLGRLGDLSQTVGTATGLTHSQASKAQELRTLLNNTLFGEGKAILGGRLPQQLMDKLQTTSVNDKMDPDLMRGALKATTGVASDVLDSTYKQRFGGEAVRPGSSPVQMETQTHNGSTYQRKAGSSDPWVRVDLKSNSVNKPEVPPAGLVDKLQEGQGATSPSGKRWVKRHGILVPE